MTTSPATLDAIAVAERAQSQAIEPRASAWVSASAGSGKTTVLTNRVLALMLAGAAPQRILCLTFTKAAAAEMANRVTGRLGEWVTDTEDKLATDITALLARAPEPEDMKRARQLFARVLDAPGGLRIETIHAFCQSLLRRFPVEAGVSPQFELMDERTAAEALAEGRDRVIASGNADDTELNKALAYMTGRLHETRFPDIVAEIARHRAKFERLLRHHGGVTERGLTNVVAAMRGRLGLSLNDDQLSIRRAACNDTAFDGAALRRATAALAKGSRGDQERAAEIHTWLAEPQRRIDLFDDYALHFLTKAGTIRADKNLATQAACKADPDALRIMQREAARLLAISQRLARLTTAEATGALLCIAERILRAYGAYKQMRSLLDYDDLIQITLALLQRPGVAAWVLYKLDGGLDHVLIDEAQDTNPEQWRIIASLTDEFFAGEGRFEDRELQTTPARTIFAVGDRKQSIYSFQGADPTGFNRWRQTFAEKIVAAERGWRDVQMNVSFRSTQSVLKAVDLVFGLPTAREGVALSEETIAHIAARVGHAGRVEVWPPVIPLNADEPTPWKPPVERVRGDSPQNRLAALIARRIARMISAAEILPARGRPIQAGDIMVLVRRRTSFVDELVRQLKALDIPVAGVDRMILPQQLAVMDLIALGQFLLLPSDDLTLATILKSPLMGLTEEELFDLAHPRGDKSLWEALSSHAGSDSRYGQAHRQLADLLAKVDYLSPFTLFSHVIVACDGRRKALGRLGLDADDPIDEFLALALAYEKNHPPSLQAFLHWVEQGEIEIKRDLEQGGGDAVRIMTVHGAKGLQAPIVFLPDTMQAPTQRDAVLWTNEAIPAPLWVPSATDADDISGELREAAKASQLEEYRRLLYVAMTRAEDRLYICGWENKRASADGHWYSLIRAAIEPMASQFTDAFLAENAVTSTAEVLVLENSQSVPAKAEVHAPAIADIKSLPQWAITLPPPERDPPQPLAPSRAAAAEPAVISPLAEDQKNRFQRGIIIHRLLQTLPDLPIERREIAARALVERPEWKLAVEAQQAIVTETLNVLNTPAFEPLFSPGSLAEVPVTGLVGRHAVSGQIDRLAITDTEVWIIDYKTNRPPPQTLERVDSGYVFQMAVYRDLLRRIYPAHQVRCVLLWTDGPYTMELPAAMLDGAITSVAA
ncbi:MAG: double-strand break repair helicase AddA [Rhodospirillaceae bacterium]|nr:double-strand break repair helicase AddA [Rhodospirillaceae bacterium]